ncbi:MAG: response regulator [Proteobacteria bacterium]|nr:response regulator [Pseudomonadota bacterium]MBU4297022.1 response regulator [Pseudomonadota bacterium]
MRILIAEDDLTSRIMLSAVLKKDGHEVVETANGSEALALLQKSDAPRLAILDWMMPGMDGLEVVRRIRAMPSLPPPYIIILTARGGKSSIIAGLDAGADDYLSKPFDSGELRARIEVGSRMVRMQEELSAQVRELREAIDHIKTLQGIIPICSFCKKIRDDQGYWAQVEAYVSRHSDARFSHGICPECLKKNYPGCCEKDDDGEERT